MGQEKLKKKIRRLLIFFNVALIISGLTAIPVELELETLLRYSEWMPSSICMFLSEVNTALNETVSKFPYLFYGYDWLAFAHIVIAVFFIGPINDPVKNIWTIESGMVACILIFPFAFFLGTMRGIPAGWMLIDCSFGVIGLIPLWFARKYTIQLRNQLTEQTLSKKTRANEKGILV